MNKYYGKVRSILIVVLLAVALLSASVATLWGGVSVAMADTEALADIVAPATGFNPIVHYEFQDETDLGKDTLGNYNLVAKDVTLDPINGGVALKNSGLLYAPALDEVTNDEYTDFSDLVKGSFSISLRAYLRNNNGGGNYLVSTGSYGSHFTMNWAYGGFGMNFGNSQNKDFMNDGSKDMLSGEFAWYRVNVIYDESAMTVKLVATKEGVEDYSFTMSETLSQTITFGGNSQYSFTIGAQSHLGGWDDQHASAELSDGTNVWPNISDFRLYSGVIDDAEITKIKEYDKANKTEVQTYETNPIASYTFSDTTTVGADDMGNVDLALKSTNADDYVITDGALTLKNNNVLYAKNLGNGKDIADKLDTFTIVLDVKMANPGGGEFDILSTGKYDEALRVTRNGNSLNFYVGGNDTNQWKENVFLDNEWQTIIVTGNVSNKYMAIYINKPGDTQATLIASVSNAEGLALANNCSLTFGGDSQFGAADSQHSNPTIKNIKIFDFTFGSAQATQYLTVGKVEVETIPLSSVKKLSTTVSVTPDMSEDDILACALPTTVQVTNAANNIADANIVWNKVVKGDFSAKLYGFLIGSNINNQQNVKVELTVPYSFGDEYKQDIKPIVWYEFKDADNIGKDSMGHFDLLVGGNGQVEHNAEEGYVTFTRANGSVLYAPALYGSTDWSDMLKGGYTFSYTVKADNTIQDGSYYAVTTGTYGESFLIYGCYSGFEVIYSAGGSSSHKIRFETGSYKDQWVTITVTVDPTTSTCCFYVNDALFAEREISDYQGFSADGLYTFAIGGQANVSGNDSTQYFEGSISDVKVYDYVLSADNVKDLYTTSSFSSVPTYYTIKKIDVDTSDVELVLSKDNTVTDILAGLPTTVTVTNNKGQTETCSVIWLGRKDGIIEGYVQGCSWANTDGGFATVELSYVVEFDDVENAQFTEVKVDDVAYTGAALAVGTSANVTFKVVPSNGYKVSSVVCNTEKLTAGENGLYTVSVSDYSKVVAYISAEEYTITYVLNNGSENETQIYGYGETVELATYFTKEGYTFDGWYLNAEFTGEKVTTIDSNNPANVTLYAKWTAEGENNDDTPNTPIDDEGGSNSVVVIVIASVVAASVVAGVVVIIIKKRRQRND